MKITTAILVTITCLSSTAYAGGFNSFAYGFSQTYQQKQQNQATDYTDYNVTGSTGITHGDVDVLMAEYNECMDANPPLTKSRDTYFKNKARAINRETNEAKKNSEREQFKNEFMNERNASFDAHTKLCNSQLETHKQQIIRQRTAQVIQQQQQVIAQQRRQQIDQQKQIDQLKQGAGDADTRATAAEMDADQARSDADRARADAASYQRQR